MTPQVSPRRARATLFVLSLAAFAFVTTEILPIGLLTLISPALDRSLSEVGLLVSGYAVVVVLASLPLTRLTQRIPRRHLLGVTLVVFAASNAVAAASSTYAILAGARLITALTQALFWSVVSPTVTGLFPVAVRGRVVALFAAGPALSPVLGVPLGTWLGQRAGWPAPFAVLAVAGLVIAAAVVTLLPVSHFSAATLPPLLFVGGAAGVVGTIMVARSLDARPAASLLVPLALSTGSMLGLYALGTLQPVTIVLLAGIGASFSAFATAVQNRMLQLAPGSTDLASAGAGTAFNIGIAAGSLLGGALLSGHGPRPIALVGALLTLAALTVLATDARVRPRTPHAERLQTTR